MPDSKTNHPFSGIKLDRMIPVWAAFSLHVLTNVLLAPGEKYGCGMIVHPHRRRFIAGVDRLSVYLRTSPHHPTFEKGSSSGGLHDQGHDTSGTRRSFDMNRIIHKKPTLCILGSVASLLFILVPVASAQVAFEKGDGKMDITIDGKPFATYVWNDSATTRPYFKQVHALGGKIQVTRHHPPRPGDFSDHENYHPGIWWGFGDVGGNDYWRMKAKVIGGSFIEQPTSGEDRGSFAVRNKMLTNDGKKTFCHQVSRYTIIKRPSGILMVCESTFTRDESDFWLGDQEEMGMAIRVATPIATRSKKGGYIRDSAGRTEHKQIRTNQSDWCDYSGPIAGKHGGILLMNDPQNFRKPWWHARDTGLLIANPLGESELNGRGKKRQNVLVKKGQPFRLRYGVLIHLHDTEKEFDPKTAYKDFLEITSKEISIKTSAVRSDLPTVPAGFKVSIFANEPMVYKPTAICFDAKGRLFVGQGPQYPRNLEDTPTDSVVILIDSDNDGVADESKTFATGFNSVQGLAWKGRDLYVANAPELTIVRDLDGDDEADEYVVVYTDLGNREHALHGLNWGPDGKLYMSKGNSKGHNQPEKYGYVAPRPFRELWDVVHPPGAPDSYPPKTYTKDNYKKTYHHWDDDWGRQGGVLRCEPLGKNLEIVSRGLRNPWDITMDDGFNWLGTDNDQSQGDRIMMPFFGANFGWGHTYSSHWTGENHLPTAPISGPVFPGSGTGIIFYSHQHFPAEYRSVFFINDWMHGTYVYRPVWEGALIQPKGGRWQPFVQRGNGKMLYRPTDLEFAPDGSIYICGWGGDYHYDRNNDGSWMYRVTHSGRPAAAKSEWFPEKRSKPYVQWDIEQLVEDLGPEVLPVWRVNAQDELVRRGRKVCDALIQAIESGRLSQGQQTWAIWAIGRIVPEDRSIDKFISKLVALPKQATQSRRLPLNLRIQALRILAFRIRNYTHAKLPEVAVASLTDPEPRIRFEAVQAICQANQRQHLSALVNQLAKEEDRLVFYAGWQTLRKLSDVAYRKRRLADKRPAVRLAALLSLLERHEITLDEVLKIAEHDSDSRIQNWAITWAMNPRPPRKMPNSKTRIVLEESVSIRDLIKRAKKAKRAKLRQMYLTMVSRATYRGDDDWKRIRDFYRELENDDERALVVVPLARDDDAKPLLWDALAGNTALRRAAVRGMLSLSSRPGNSPEAMAQFLLGEIAKNPRGPRVAGATEAISRLDIPVGWKPRNGWDVTLSQVFEGATDVLLRARTLTILLAIDPLEVVKGQRIKGMLEKASRDPDPRLYASLRTLNPRVGVEVEMRPPEKATIKGVLAKLPDADARRGRELFFSKASSIACAACHRISGRGNSFAPDLSGIGIRSKPEVIIQSILEPSATITEGFQLHTLVTHDGIVFSGAILAETNSEIRLIKTDGTLEIIATNSVENRRKTKLSAMPTGFELLGDDQVADIAAFLATCKHGSIER
jgi:putative membrane-bound dehydrogenase-like protein